MCKASTDKILENIEVIDWLLEDLNPEVKLRYLKEYLGRNDDDPEVIQTKQNLFSSTIFLKAMELLKSDKVWSKYDALTSFAEWGLTRYDLDMDHEVYALIDKTGFKPMCGEALLLRNLVKLGYYTDDAVKDEINNTLQKIKEDGGFGCLSKNKKINDPKQSHRSCARITSNYLLLIAEMQQQGLPIPCKEELIHYFLKRNVLFRTDDMTTIVVEGFDSTYFPPEAIMNGVQNLLYALSILGVANDERCNDAWDILYAQRNTEGRYILTKTKTKPCFKVGAKGKVNKWVTLYALLAEKYKKCEMIKSKDTYS